MVLPWLVMHAEAADLSSSRRVDLENLLTQDCGSCHGLTLKGGLGPPLTPEAVSDTSLDVLIETITHGRPLNAMPPWGPLLAPAEIRWLAERLKRGVSAP
ncbi:MAG: cytochrome c [Magnetococcales bacterium]|nr:cytochrome c [Magnetococcales bacterium]